MTRAEPRTLADWRTWPVAGATTNDAVATPAADGLLDLRVQPARGRAGLVLRPTAGAWDLGAHGEVAVTVRNLGDQPTQVILRVDDDRSADVPSVQHRGGLAQATVPPGGEVRLAVALGTRRLIEQSRQLVSMVGTPYGGHYAQRLNGEAITAVWVFVPDPATARHLAVSPVTAEGEPLREDVPAERFYPFIDAFGQYAHRDWPGKIHTAADLAAQREAEETDLAAHPRPNDWNAFGGWTGGPQLAATGFFRAEKVNGFWWLVDPTGRLFWSHGVVRVGTRVRVGTEYRGTPLDDREHYFTLPPVDSELGAFYGTEPRGSRGYYTEREGHRVYDFLEANLYRKYGADWRRAYADRAHRRLASWGLNSIANSSDPAIYEQRRTPYTAIVYSVPLGRAEFRIEASGGAWGKLPDPFDPGLGRLIQRTLATDLKDCLADPWCLGFFVDNELNWGDAGHVAAVTFASPASQPAKRVLVEHLTRSYQTIAALNAAWGTTHAGWDALLASTTPPDRTREAVQRDLAALSEVVIEQYFRLCHDAVEAAAPHHLYLGCRFAGVGNELVMRAAAKYCDVVSINRYAVSVDDLRLPGDLDRPIVIGEFHFVGLDRGLFHAGLQITPTQDARARAYTGYVTGALRNPAIVGTHWFQCYDQPTTGRFDGENYQTGLLDICDTPYPETIAACRALGAGLYETRAAAAAAQQGAR